MQRAASGKPGADMSKIPQGEWNAIAARYAQGESISRIAQSYGCTPPAIHYILKRNRLRTTQPLSKQSSLSPDSTRERLQPPTEPTAVRLSEIRGDEHGVV